MTESKYTPEFFKWAREHGYPDRQPRGSPSNYDRARLLLPLLNQYLKEMSEAKRSVVKI